MQRKAEILVPLSTELCFVYVFFYRYRMESLLDTQVEFHYLKSLKDMQNREIRRAIIPNPAAEGRGASQ